MKTNRRNVRTLSNGGFKEVFKVALPLILSNSCHAANMFFDRLMLARYSNEAVAAAFTGGLTHFTIACIFIGTIGYTGTFVAQYEGARHRERIGSAMWQGIWLTLLGSALLTTGIWWAEPLFSCFNHDASASTVCICRGNGLYRCPGNHASRKNRAYQLYHGYGW